MPGLAGPAAADLICRPPASAGPVGGAAAAIRTTPPIGEVRPGSGTVPALVSGRLTAPPPPRATVLVAVNGRIGGGAEPFPERPGEPAVRCRAHPGLPLWRAGDGHRQLQLYLLDRGGGGPRLQPVSVPAS